MDDRAILGTEVELPSRGLLYEGKIPDGKVVVGPMTLREEKVIASAGPNSGVSIIDTLLRNCVFADSQGSPIDMSPDDYLTGDRFFLVMAIRAVSFGQKYEFRMKCEGCRRTYVTSVNVPDDLEPIFLAEGFEEPFEVELPFSKVKLGLRLLRGDDDKEITRWSEQQYKRTNVKEDGDPAYVYRMAKTIAWVDVPENTSSPFSGQRIENTSKKATQDISSFLEGGMHVRDTTAYRDAMSANDCGMDTEIEFNCPHCKEAFVEALPQTIEFFRPGGRKGVRYV